MSCCWLPNGRIYEVHCESICGRWRWILHSTLIYVYERHFEYTPATWWLMLTHAHTHKHTNIELTMVFGLDGGNALNYNHRHAYIIIPVFVRVCVTANVLCVLEGEFVNGYSQFEAIKNSLCEFNGLVHFCSVCLCCLLSVWGAFEWDGKCWIACTREWTPSIWIPDLKYRARYSSVFYDKMHVGNV